MRARSEATRCTNRVEPLAFAQMATEALDDEEARAFAIAAVARGWLDAGEVWDAALRYARAEGRARYEDVFTLSPNRVTGLSSEVGQTQRPEATVLAPSRPLHSVAPSAEAKPAEPPARSARYTLGDELGRGGSGRVVAAADHETGRTVALKTLRYGVDAHPNELRRFLDEARLTAQLEHPGVVPVYDLGALHDGQPFYTMRVVSRRSLREVLSLPLPRREWPLARLCSAFVQVCHAVGYAHARGVLHRDLKPENILLGDHGEVYVADWGLAKRLSAPEIEAPATAPEALETNLTLVGSMMGTLGYMPPEQARGQWDNVDHRADLFALGAILYEILTGRGAFDGPTPAAVLVATLERESEAASRDRALVPALAGGPVSPAPRQAERGSPALRGGRGRGGRGAPRRRRGEGAPPRGGAEAPGAGRGAAPALPRPRGRAGAARAGGPGAAPRRLPLAADRAQAAGVGAGGSRRRRRRRAGEGARGRDRALLAGARLRSRIGGRAPRARRSVLVARPAGGGRAARAHAHLLRVAGDGPRRRAVRRHPLRRRARVAAIEPARRRGRRLSLRGGGPGPPRAGAPAARRDADRGGGAGARELPVRRRAPGLPSAALPGPRAPRRAPPGASGPAHGHRDRRRVRPGARRRLHARR